MNYKRKVDLRICDSANGEFATNKGLLKHVGDDCKQGDSGGVPHFRTIYAGNKFHAEACLL